MNVDINQRLNDFMQSIGEAAAIARGEAEPSRRFVVERKATLEDVNQDSNSPPKKASNPQANEWGVGARKRDFDIKVNGSPSLLVNEYYYDIVSGELLLYFVETKHGDGLKAVNEIRWMDGDCPDNCAKVEISTFLKLYVSEVVSAEIMGNLSDDTHSNDLVRWRVHCKAKAA